MEGLPTGRFWGKLERDVATGLVVGWHPLEDHCADVAAVCAVLLKHTLLARRLARLTRRERLTPVQIARLCVLAALHDLGKFNLGFQNKATNGTPTAGHVTEGRALVDEGDTPPQRALMEILAPLGVFGDGGLSLLLAALAHHGRPVARSAVQSALWRAEPGGRDPMAAIRDLVACTQRWFPEAFSSTDPRDELPTDPAFQHAFAGVVMLADWLGSDTTWFAFRREGEGDRWETARCAAQSAATVLALAPRAHREALGEIRVDFARIRANPLHEARGAQRTIDALVPAPDGSVSVIEAETGSGKTEAAILHFLRLYQAGVVDGLYFALPTRAAATQLHRRVYEIVVRVFGATHPPVVLAVPGYLRVDDIEGKPLPHFKVLWPDGPGERQRWRGWASENPKRYLAGAISVGTIDQVLLGALQTSHAHLRGAVLLRQLLVIDEVHASDAYMTELLRVVLEHHRAAGGHAMLLSATLGTDTLERLLTPRGGVRTNTTVFEVACERAYPVITQAARGTLTAHAVPADPSGADAGKTVMVDLVADQDDPARVAAAALDAAERGAAVLVIRNTVRLCRATQAAVEAEADRRGRADLLFQCEGVRTPHHARYAPNDRKALDAAVEGALRPTREVQRGVVVVATQTLEQSLDVDADFLITDLCPMDVLLQRIGRLHRHRGRARPTGHETARCVVLVPAEDLGARLRDDGSVRGGAGYGQVYVDLRVLQATLDALVARGRLVIPAMNRRLVEEATHPEALERVANARDERWRKHGEKIRGATQAHRGLANVGALEWTKDFTESSVLFGEVEGTLRTRLGEDTRRVDLGGVAGPFGTAVRDLAIAGYMAKGITADAEAEGVVSANGEVRFRLGGKAFVYGRLGVDVDEGEGK